MGPTSNCQFMCSGAVNATASNGYHSLHSSNVLFGECALSLQ